MKSHNIIPRKFNRITGNVLIETNMDRAGDTLHITKNDFGYLALNTRTGKYAYIFPSMIRSKELFLITSID